MGEESRPVSDALEESAWVLLDRGDVKEAYELQQKSLDIRRRLPKGRLETCR